MFQTFEERTSPAQGAAHLPLVRAELKRRGLDGFIVPHEDEFQNEYLPASNERLAWLTGFTGSAGAAVVLGEKAAVFADGRYTLQVRAQTDTALFEPLDFRAGAVATWIAANAAPGARIGYDPWLHSIDALDALRDALKAKSIELVPCKDNPIDAAWTGRPAAPKAPVVAHGESYSGEASIAKRERLAAKLGEGKADAAIITSPASVAWLLNVRGGDVPHTPLPLGRAILYSSGAVDLFIEREKISPGLEAHLGNGCVIRPPSEFVPALGALGGKTVSADPGSAPSAVFSALGDAKATIKRGADPCIAPRAIKNAAEITGTRAAHARDGAALSRFLHWLSREGASGELSEIDAAEKLEAFRRANGALKDVSFETISGAGANGAIVHYRVTTKTNRAIEPGSLFLVDSGAQYLDGTTDVTRTIAVGTPSEEMRDRFTRVLKGHIALGSARFPEGTCGAHLDALARLALWQAGLDYDHGTGHGVGSYLGVHEGPQNISKAMRNVPLEPGMIVSNEPGYYKTGAYGIRIENLVLVTPAEQIPGGDRPMMGFETLTLAPIDRHLIVRELLTEAERNWLNAYHARVAAVIGPQLDGEAKAWLDEATRPI
ncbi:MAG: aminopeptidase P family protein [Alphaproteobacteria bacterium]